MSEAKNLLHPITKPNNHQHEDGEECIGESLDQSRGHVIRGLIDSENVHWLSREDVLEFIVKERDTFQKVFGHLAGMGDMHPQYVLAAQVLSGFGGVLELSTQPDHTLVTDLSDEALASLLSSEASESALDDAFGSIADALREAKDNQPPAE